MSATPSKPKQTSRWGSLLSGAVANLESRLDTILADENTIASRNAQVYPNYQPSSDRLARTKESNSNDLSRASSTSRSRPPQTDPSSKPSAVESSTHSPSLRTSSESRQPASTPKEPPNVSEKQSDVDHTSTSPEHIDETVPASLDAEKSHEPPGSEAISRSVTPALHYDSAEASDTASRPSLDQGEGLGIVGTEQRRDAESSNDLTHEEFKSRIAQLHSDNETAEARRQEEVQSHLERIDALESKLQYLSTEAAEAARQAASQASPDSLEKKLAEKDEQIALLMQEGQKLSKAEVTQSSLARKLRIKAAEDDKSITELRKKLSTAEKGFSELSDKIRKLEFTQKDSSTKLLRIPRLEREVESLKASRDEKEATVQTLRQRLDSESKRADEAAKQSNEAALEEQKKRIKALEEDLSNAKIEKQLADGRAKTEHAAVQDELQQEKEKAKSDEAVLRNEISVLENTLEALRSRTEEASSGSTNDAQAKLLRQVETLQSQYALARENWQGIEGSLQSRITAVENERAEIARQENESRKKAREAASNSRQLQEALDETSRKCQILEQDLTQHQTQANKLEARLLDFERDLKSANDKLDQERQSWDTNLNRRIEEEKTKWRQEMASFPGPESLVPSTESPVSLSRKGTLEVPGIHSRRTTSRNTSADLNIPILERPTSRRSSTKPARSFDIGSPNDFDSGRSTPFLNGNAIPESPSLNDADVDPDDLVETGSSPQRTMNDVISGSTSAAGPSVQLVERMSAKVRRLESEKAASKDELARITAQREEARQEVVALMREVEAKREVDAKIAKLEGDMAQVGQRYHTTLEMLGEKSERVEELEADVADLKKIYRELVESTIK